MAEKSAKATSVRQLPRIPFQDLTFNTLSDRFKDRAMPRISRILVDVHVNGLGEQV
jgi:hypothetical protein